MRGAQAIEAIGLTPNSLYFSLSPITNTVQSAIHEIHIMERILVTILDKMNPF